MVVDAVGNDYPLLQRLEFIGMARSSYFYHKAQQSRAGKYQRLRTRIKELFEQNLGCYGYRRVKAVLKRDGYRVSEKVVRRLMKEQNLVVRMRRRRQYNSYAGEITPEVPNLLKRDFRAASPNVKWLTDMTEFAIPSGKVYLNAVMDCFDGMIVGWKLGISPNAQLAFGSLMQAIETSGGSPLILHSDRGWHYRVRGWLRITELHKIARSMSKKGCSPDNSACEGLFGRLKTECFYGKDFSGFSCQKFINYIADYIRWHNHDRIKLSLNSMSPIEFRRANGYAI